MSFPSNWRDVLGNRIAFLDVPGVEEVTADVLTLIESWKDKPSAESVCRHGDRIAVHGHLGEHAGQVRRCNDEGLLCVFIEPNEERIP